MNLDDLKSAARPHKTRTSFRLKEPRAYRVAQADGVLDDVCAHMTQADKKAARKGRKWTKDAIIAEAARFPDGGTFRVKSRSAYVTALREGWMEELSWNV